MKPPSSSDDLEKHAGRRVQTLPDSPRFNEDGAAFSGFVTSIASLDSENEQEEGSPPFFRNKEMDPHQLGWNPKLANALRDSSNTKGVKLIFNYDSHVNVAPRTRSFTDFTTDCDISNKETPSKLFEFSQRKAVEILMPECEDVSSMDEIDKLSG